MDEKWTIKKAEHQENWCLWNVGLEKTLESPLDSKEIKPANPKGNQPWLLIRRTEAEALILQLLDGNNQHIGNDPDAEKDWRQKEKQATEDEMGGWQHQLNGHEFEQTLGGSEGQGSPVCYNPLCCRVGHNLVTEQQSHRIAKKFGKTVRRLCRQEVNFRLHICS